MHKERNSKTIGGVLSVLGGIGALATAGVVYYTISNFHTGSPLLKGVGIGGSLMLTIVTVGVAGSGIYFIRKTTPKELKEIREIDRNLSFEDFMKKYPNPEPGFLKDIFSEKELTEKFIKYVRTKNLSYSDVVRSFIPFAFPEDVAKNNPWGFTLGNGFVQSKALEELAIKEIESIRDSKGVLTPRMIFDHFENREIVSPIISGDVSTITYAQIFASQLRINKDISYKELKEQGFTKVLDQKAIGEYLMDQFLAKGVKGLIAIHGDGFWQMLDDKLITLRNGETNFTYLCIDDLRRKFLREIENLSFAEIVQTYSMRFLSFVSKTMVEYIILSCIKTSKVPYAQLQKHFEGLNLSNYYNDDQLRAFTKYNTG